MKEELAAIDAQIMRIIEQSADHYLEPVDFNRVAIAIFQFQYHHNPFYRIHCESLRITRNSVQRFEQIPALTVQVYKRGEEVSTVPKVAQGVEFSTSGTSGKPGLIYRDPDFFNLRKRALWVSGKNELFSRFYPQKVRIVFLDFPNRRNIPDFPLNYSILHNYMVFFGNEKSVFVDVRTKEGQETFRTIVTECRGAGAPLVIFGPSYRISNLMTKMHQEGKQSLALPHGSIVMDSGGLKNSADHSSYESYLQDLWETFQIGRMDYINTYALSEVGSHFSDNIRLQCATICKQCPPWARVRVVKQTSMGEVDCEEGEEGEIIIYDLLNRGSIFALRTGDLGVRTPDGFQVKERV